MNLLHKQQTNYNDVRQTIYCIFMWNDSKVLQNISFSSCSNIKAQQSYNVWLISTITQALLLQIFPSKILLFMFELWSQIFSVDWTSSVHIQQRNETFSGPPTGNHNLVCRVSSVSCSYEFSRSSRYISCTIQFSDTSIIFFCVSKCRFESINGYISAFLWSKEIMSFSTF